MVMLSSCRFTESGLKWPSWDWRICDSCHRSKSSRLGEVQSILASNRAGEPKELDWALLHLRVVVDCAVVKKYFWLTSAFAISSESSRRANHVNTTNYRPSHDITIN
jgi:hypothetical protein